MTDIANSKDFAGGWKDVSVRLRRVRDTHAWECGQLLIDDPHFGLLSQRANEDLRVLTKVTRHHYVQKPGFIAWRDLLRNIAKYKAQSEVLSTTIFWSERSAYDALENLAVAGQHLALGERDKWHEKMSEAYLCAAEYLAEVAIATAATEKSTRATFPASRLKEIADSMSSMVEAEQARLASHLDIYRAQTRALDVLIGAKMAALAAVERARRAAESAKVDAMPRWRRYVYVIQKAFESGC